MSNYGTLQGSFSSFSDNEKLNYSLKIALSRLQTDLKADWFNEPTDFIPKQPLELYKNTIPSYKSVNNFLLIDPDVDGKGKEMVTNKTVGDILSVSSNGSQFTLNDILNTSKVRNPTQYSELEDSDFVDGASRTQIKLLGRNMFTRYKYWTSGLTGKNSLLEGIAKAGGGSNTGTTPDREEPFNAYITYTDTGDLSPERRWSVINGASESSDHKKFYNKLISEGVELNIIDPTLKSDLTKKHPFLKLYLQVPTYTTRGTAPISQNDNNSSSGQVDKTDNIGFHNPLMEKALGDTNGFLSGAGYQIAGWNGSTWKSVTTSYGTPGYQNILYFLSNPGFILIYGQKNIDYGYLTSRSHPPMISFIKYSGETFSDGIISQGETLPAVSLPKDLFINTSDNTIHRYDGSKWVSVGGGGGGSINELSDALVEDNSIYLGNDPSSTTDDAQYNVAVGTTALDAITTGDRNVAMGYDALLKNTTGKQNVAIGHQALEDNISGNYNTALGEEALLNNTTARSNTAIGHECMKSNETGNYNTAIGEAAMKDHLSGDNNVVIGREALKDNNIKAENNVVIGVWALKKGTCGDHNVVIGHRSQYEGKSYDNTICLGYNASVTADNMCRIGNDDMKVGIGTSSPECTLDVNGDVKINGGLTLKLNSGWTIPFLYPNPYSSLSDISNIRKDTSDDNKYWLDTDSDVDFNIVIESNETLMISKDKKFNIKAGYTVYNKGIIYMDGDTTPRTRTQINNSGIFVNKGKINSANKYEYFYNKAGAKFYNLNKEQGPPYTTLYNFTQPGWSSGGIVYDIKEPTSGSNIFDFGRYNYNYSTYTPNFIEPAGSNRIDQDITALIKSGNKNFAIGYNALKTNITGTNNTAIGYGADVGPSNLTNATAIGYNAKVTTDDTIQLGNTNLKNVKTSGTITADSFIGESVGIGTKNPRCSLDVNSSSSEEINTILAGVVNDNSFYLGTQSGIIPTGHPYKINTIEDFTTAGGANPGDVLYVYYNGTYITKFTTSNGSLVNLTNDKGYSGNGPRIGAWGPTTIKMYAGGLSVLTSINDENYSNWVGAGSQYIHDTRKKPDGETYDGVGNFAWIDWTAKGITLYRAGKGSNVPEATIGSIGGFNSTNAKSLIKFQKDDRAKGSIVFTSGDDTKRMDIAVDGTVTVNGTFSNSSDDRIKHNEKPIINALDTIKLLNPVKYLKNINGKFYPTNHNFLLDQNNNPIDESGNIIDIKLITETGFIAQSVEKIEELKHLVKSNSSKINTPYSLCYNGIIPYNTKAIKELDSMYQQEKIKLEAAETKIAALETENLQVKSRLDAIEARLTAAGI